MLLCTPLLLKEQVGRCKSSEDEARAGVPVPLECLPQHRGTLTLHPAGAQPSQTSSLAKTMEKAVANNSRARSSGQLGSVMYA